MNKDWSDLHKVFQRQIKKEDSFKEGILQLLELRKEMMNVIAGFRNTFTDNDFRKMPIVNSSWYANKTIAYHLYHVLRIEDIVGNILISDKKDILIEKNYNEKINIRIVTTGNEMSKEEVNAFSENININELYKYLQEVYDKSNIFISSLSFKESRKRFSEDDKRRLKKSGYVSDNDNASWLIDYWCNKDVSGLLKMPFSRHWIMHIEACNKIIGKIKK